MSTPCGPNYFKGCIRTWLKKKSKCPLCKASIKEKLRINTALKAAIEANAGPLCLERKESKTQRFLSALIANNVDKAAKELDANVDPARVVDAGARLTPLLWACKKGHRDLAIEIAAMPTVDIHARCAAGRSALWYAADAKEEAALFPVLFG